MSVTNAGITMNAMTVMSMMIVAVVTITIITMSVTIIMAMTTMTDFARRVLRENITAAFLRATIITSTRKNTASGIVWTSMWSTGPFLITS